MRFFDYIFYRISRYYIVRWEQDTGPIYGCGFVLLMWVFHIGLISTLVALAWEPANHYLFELWVDTHSWHPAKAILLLVIFGLILLRYLKFRRYKDLDKLWGAEDQRQRRRRAWGIALYATLNAVITTIFAVYRAANT